MTVCDVTVLTASMPERSNYLQECVNSVRAQNYQPQAHLIGIDSQLGGAAKMVNSLIPAVTTKWIALLADDDIFYPHHLEVLVEAGDDHDADMVYPWCETEGRGGWNPNALYDEQRLWTDNYIPATVLIKTDVVREVGGYPEVVCEDHAMWIKLLQANKRIVCVPVITWRYRFHKNDHGGVANISDGYNPWILKDSEDTRKF